MPAGSRTASASVRCHRPRRGLSVLRVHRNEISQRFTLNDAPFLAIAGLWREGAGNQPPAFTMLTTEPGEDVAPYHKRQVVVLRPDNWSAWIGLMKPEKELLRPLPAGSLKHEQVR